MTGVQISNCGRVTRSGEEKYSTVCDLGQSLILPSVLYICTSTLYYVCRRLSKMATLSGFLFIIFLLFSHARMQFCSCCGSHSPSIPQVTVASVLDGTPPNLHPSPHEYRTWERGERCVAKRNLIRIIIILKFNNNLLHRWKIAQGRSMEMSRKRYFYFTFTALKKIAIFFRYTLFHIL